VTQLNLNTAVGEWVDQRPHTVRIFDMLQIDYCGGGGGTSLEQACWDRQLTPQNVLAQLHESGKAENGADAQGRGITQPRCL